MLCRSEGNTERERHDSWADVNDLKQRIDGLVEEVKNLKKQVSKLRAENKEWEKQVSKLRAENKEWEKRVESLEAQVKELNAENAILKGENMQLEEKTANLQERVTEYQEKVTGLTRELAEVRTEYQEKVTGLTRELAEVQDKLSSMVSTENDLMLSELCWRIQSIVFKKVLPPSLYFENLNYKLQFINQEIDALPVDRDKAKNAWSKLQQELKYTPVDIYRLTAVFREIQSERNTTAHPPLTEEIVYQIAKRMKDEGQEGAKSYESVMQLINLWKKLRDMQ